MNAAVKPYHHGNLAEAILLRAAEIIDEEGIEHLTLRGIARDLGVSHAAPNRHFRNKTALLAALAAEAWQKATDATLGEAQRTDSANAHVRLNAMGRGYLRWALNNRALFRAMIHPDVNRYATAELSEAVNDVPLPILAIYTNAVPLGAAVLMVDSLLSREYGYPEEQEALIEQVIDLVVPLER